MRIYDPRIGKFLSVNPLTKSYPELTLYQFASNCPIEAIDLDGGEARHISYKGCFPFESLPSDQFRHKIPADDYMLSNDVAKGGAANESRGAIVAGGVVLVVVAAPYLASVTTATLWRVGIWTIKPQNQLLLAEGPLLRQDY